MIPTSALILPAGQASASLSLLPVGAALLGGVLAWKLWQQRQENKQQQIQQQALNEQLDALKNQLDDIQSKETTEQTKSTVKKDVSDTTKSSDQPLTGNGLFEQLIDDNIALRKAES